VAVEEGTKARFSDGDKSSFSYQKEDGDRCKWATKRFCLKSYLGIKEMPSGKSKKPEGHWWPLGPCHIKGEDNTVPGIL